MPLISSGIERDRRRHTDTPIRRYMLTRLLPVPFLPQMPKILFPVFRKAANLKVGKRHDSQHLAANNQKLPVARASDRKRAPEPGALKALQLPTHNQPIPQSRGTTVIDLRSNHDRAFAGINHATERPAK